MLIGELSWIPLLARPICSGAPHVVAWGIMTPETQAERWILSRCSEADETVHVHFSKTDLPDGVTIELLKYAFGKLKQAGRVDGGIADPDNAAPYMRLKCLDEFS